MLDYKGVMEYAKNKYGTDPERLWEKWPEYAVLRHSGSDDKWYGILMNVPADKLGMDGTDIKWVLDVKCDPLLITGLIQEPGYLPAYHMNKKNWISIVLDGSVPDNEIEERLDASYDLTK